MLQAIKGQAMPDVHIIHLNGVFIHVVANLSRNFQSKFLCIVTTEAKNSYQPSIPG